jgi:tRNA pseudouridine13 synthase
MGIDVYSTNSVGIGGVIRENVEDFAVEEILVDGSQARIRTSDDASRRVLGFSFCRNHYLLCVMVKRNWDTFIAIKNIANQLGIRAKQIQIAGIKDARAVTAQYITVEDASPEQVQNISVKDIQIRPLGYLTSEMSAFYLLGNNFTINVRDVNHSKLTIKRRIAKTIEQLEEVGGIPNFFGHQRFGTIRPITHLVGKEIIKGNFEKAVLVLLAKPSQYEHPESRLAREELMVRRNFKRALKDFPKQLRYERFMLRHLTKRPADFVGAFRSLPIKLRQLFIQAYQSYLFNKFLSGRIELGIPVNIAEPGDYVVNLERTGLPMRTMHRIANPAALTEINRSIESAKMRLAIPLVGFKQRLSQGAQGEIERGILEKERICPTQFKVTRMPEISARGGLRTAVTPLKDFEIAGLSDEPMGASKNDVRLRFTLYRSSYATILLRELMKPRSTVRAGF